MKGLMTSLNIFLLTLIIAFCANAYITSVENTKEIARQRQITDRQIEELKKEIRVLKTDMRILEEGTRK